MGRSGGRVSAPGPPSLLSGATLQALPGGFGGQQDGRKGSHGLLSSPQALKELKGRTEAIPCVVGDEEVWTSDVRYQASVSPAGPRCSAAPQNPGARKCALGALPPKGLRVHRGLLNSVDRWKTSKGNLRGLS